MYNLHDLSYLESYISGSYLDFIWILFETACLGSCCACYLLISLCICSDCCCFLCRLRYEPGTFIAHYAGWDASPVRYARIASELADPAVSNMHAVVCADNP